MQLVLLSVSGSTERSYSVTLESLVLAVAARDEKLNYDAHLRRKCGPTARSHQLTAAYSHAAAPSGP